MKFYNFIKRLSAFILGAVFLIGGMFKVMDPVGSGLVMESYFNFLHIGFLNGAAIWCALFFNLLECFVGVALISGIWVPAVRLISLILLLFFTLLTLLLLIFNPDMDCGCFGEAVHLTHLQSFVKNIILLILWAVAFIPFLRQHPRPVYRKVLSFIVYGIVLGFSMYSFIRLPLLDLTNLSTGKELSEGDLSIIDEEGNYADQRLLRGRVLLISIPNPSHMDEEKVLEMATSARRAGMRPVIAVGSSLPEGNSLTAGTGKIYKADRRTLLSLNRANVGASLISGGQIAQKWTMDEFLGLDGDELSELVATDPSELVVEESLDGRRKFEILALVFLILLLI